MIRTQILLPEDLYRNLKYHAFLKGVSLSELIRQNVQNKVKYKVKANGKKISASEYLLDLAKKAEKLSKKIKTKAPADLSSRIDHYLYGKN
ncbi:hypothetical protein HZB96_04335 [Candidatus Gottesmanbacteria bacterium]|nr:hypothetical protein [Candidatus Gottesmanbacteria bacterium]MBI5452163.1 hypothetical protein [Candidatus Gottesmanbacteria bacterium]